MEKYFIIKKIQFLIKKIDELKKSANGQIINIYLNCENECHHIITTDMMIKNEIDIHEKIKDQISKRSEKMQTKEYRWFVDKNYNIIGKGSYIFVNVKNKFYDENNYFGKIKKDKDGCLYINNIDLESIPKEWITLIT